MGERCEEHGREVADHAEGAGFGIHPRLAGVAIDQSKRNVVENLLEDDYIAAGCCFVHDTLPSGRICNLTPAQFHFS